MRVLRKTHSCFVRRDDDATQAVCRRDDNLTLKDRRIDAPAPRAIKQHKQKHPAEHNGQFPFVENGKELLSGRWRVPDRFTRGVYHEIRHRHFTGCDKSRKPGQKTERDHEPTDEFNNSADKHQTLHAAVSAWREPEKLLTAVTGEYKANDKPHDAINWICKSIQRLHGRSG